MVSGGDAGSPCSVSLRRTEALLQLVETFLLARRPRTDVRPRLADEADRLVDVERDHRRARELDQEVAHRGDADLLGNLCPLSRRASRSGACDLDERLFVTRSIRSSAFTRGLCGRRPRRTVSSPPPNSDPARSRAPSRWHATAPPSRRKSASGDPLPADDRWRSAPA